MTGTVCPGLFYEIGLTVRLEYGRIKKIGVKFRIIINFCSKEESVARKYDSQEVKKKTIAAGIKLFIEKGYSKTTTSDICRVAGVSNGSFFNVFHAKDGLLMELAKNMFSSQFDMAKTLLKEDDSTVMLYAVETAVQLAITELNANLREIYVEAYTNPETLRFIYNNTTTELCAIFGKFNPTWDESVFFEVEIGTASLMCGYMRYPCDRYFTFEHKVRRFLEISLKAFNIPKNISDEVIQKTLNLDMLEVAVGVINRLAESVESEYELVLGDRHA